MNLPALDSVAACTKCGLDVNNHSMALGPTPMHWCNGRHPAEGGCGLHAGEHMHRNCRRCGYVWLEECAASQDIAL